jgi:hypothetical protein
VGPVASGDRVARGLPCRAHGVARTLRRRVGRRGMAARRGGRNHPAPRRLAHDRGSRLRAGGEGGGRAGPAPACVRPATATQSSPRGCDVGSPTSARRSWRHSDRSARRSSSHGAPGPS